MNTFASTKKKLLVCLLAAAMGASAAAGGVLLKADAADGQVESKALFTVSEGVTVSPESQYEKADSTKEGDVGLRFQSQNDEAFTIELNGVFRRSFGLDWSAPADGWVAGSEVVFEIAEFGNPDNGFRIHYYSKNYQSGTWVEYDYTNKEGETETLYRTYSYDHNGTSRMIYSKDFLADPMNEHILYGPSLATTGHDRLSVKVQKAVDNNTAADVSEEGAVININANMSGYGYMDFVSFRDDPATFTPTEKTQEVYTGKTGNPAADGNYEAGFNLPRLNFENGYTVKIHVSAGLEFMAFNVGEAYAEGWTSDPWYAFGTQNGSYPVQQFSLTGVNAENKSNVGEAAATNVTPLFYQNWQAAPSITISDHENIVAAGTPITPPKATYVTNGNPSSSVAVTDVKYRVNNSGDWQTVSGTIPAQTAGNDVEVRYSVPYNSSTISETIRLAVRKMSSFSTAEVLRVDEPSVKVTPNGQSTSDVGSVTDEKTSEHGLLLEPSIEPGYSFDLVGRFTGNAELRWGAAAENGWAVKGRVEFTIAEAGNPQNYFKVIWLSPDQSKAYVEYNYNGQTLYCAQGRYGGYYYVLGNGGGDEHENDEITDNYDVQYQPWIGDAASSGILGLEWEGDVLNVMATNEWGSKQILASFVKDHEGFTLPEGAKGDKSNLPKIAFTNGYTVSVEVTGPIDFLLYDVTTTEDTKTSFAAETLSYEPLWYTRGAAMPAFGSAPVLSGVQLDGDAKLTVPEIAYTAGEGAQLKIEWVKPSGGTQEVNKNEQITLTEKGDHILRYTVTVDGADYTKEFTVHVCDYNTFVSGTLATCQTTGEGVFRCEHGSSLEKSIPVDPNAHSTVHHKGTSATCVASGVKDYWVCKYCGKMYLDAAYTEEFTDLEDTVIPQGAHELTYVPAKEATCIEDGNKAYYSCSICGKFYSDENGTQEVSKNSVKIAATGKHDMQPVPAKAPTCTEDGNSNYYKCSGCGRCTSDSKGEMEIDEGSMIMKATGHKYDEDGVCTVCGAEDPDHAATETGGGLTGGEIAAIVIAVVVLIGVTVALVFVIRKTKIKK